MKIRLFCHNFVKNFNVMKKEFFKKAILIVTLLFSFTVVYGAEEYPTEIKMKKEEKNAPKHGPRDYTYIPIKCYCDGEVLSFVSANSLCGEFMIVDEVSGEVVICAYGCINPDYQIGVSGLSGSFIIYVSIDDSIYSGFLEL